jgi:hypothetical protein
VYTYRLSVQPFGYWHTRSVSRSIARIVLIFFTPCLDLQELLRYARQTNFFLKYHLNASELFALESKGDRNDRSDESAMDTCNTGENTVLSTADTEIDPVQLHSARGKPLRLQVGG